jgi:hypothetical protein
MRPQVQPIGNKRYFGGKNQANSQKISIFAIFCAKKEAGEMRNGGITLHFFPWR